MADILTFQINRARARVLPTVTALSSAALAIANLTCAHMNFDTMAIKASRANTNNIHDVM
jgi:hypothetical protein